MIEGISIIGIISLLVFALLVGVFAGWASVKIHEAMEQNTKDILESRRGANHFNP